MAALHVPEELPFLNAISWYDLAPEELSPEEMLTRYEDGWRYVGTLGDPSPEELEFVRQLVRLYGSTIDP